MKNRHSLFALAAWALGLGACMTAAPPPALPEPVPAPTEVPGSPPSVVASPPAENPGETPPNPTHRACRLAAAKKSDDSCKTDADCGPSDPCHAPACVAKAKSKPKTPDTMCTMMMGCETADANRCGCFENRCALIPPADAAKE